MHTHIHTSIYTKDQLLLKYFKQNLFYSHLLAILFLHFYTAFHAFQAARTCSAKNNLEPAASSTPHEGSFTSIHHHSYLFGVREQIQGYIHAGQVLHR